MDIIRPMKKYEYKEHYVRFDAKLGERSAQLLRTLNELGREGWRLSRIYPANVLKTLTSWAGGLNLLLEREVTSA